MLEKFNNKGISIGSAVAMLFLAGNVIAGQGTCTTSTIQLVNATSGNINADGTIAEGTPATIKGTVTQASSGTGCAAGTAGTAVGEGTLEIKARKTNDSTPVLVACQETGIGAFTQVATADLPNTTPPGTNAVQVTQDTTNLGGLTGGFKTVYTKLSPLGTYVSSDSVCVDLKIVDVVLPPQDICTNYPGIVALYVVGGAGKGSVVAGDKGPWSYTLEVLNCTGIDDLAVKVQGGTSGWTTFSAVATNPDETVNSTAKSSGKKGTTSIVTWNTILDDQETKTITVTVDGTVPSGNAAGTMLNISGPWSAAYNDNNSSTCYIDPKKGVCDSEYSDKSAYTPQVYVEVQ